ncbi:MAG: PAS domain S-box protein, partial [Anaerolineales bacterium]
WSDVTKEIHEVDLDYKPNIETGINFYKAGVDRDTISHAVRDAIENGVSWDEELVIVTAKGNEKWVRAMGRAEFKDGVCVRLNGSFQDITQRKQAEQEFERMLELSPDLIGVGNLEGYFTRINSSFERLLGYSENELLAKPFFDFVLEDDLQSTIAEMNNAINGKNDIFIANRCKCKDGSVKWIEWDVLALNEENKFYTTGRDITDRKVYEEELEKYRFKLEDMVAERTQELVKSLAEKEVLLKEVHHRVKNNMAMVSAFIRLQMGRAENISSLNALKACENRIQAMSMVHKSLYQSNDFANINMQVLFDEIGNALCTESGYENIELEVQAGDVSLEMDSAIPCAMIVNELLTNSLKYAFADGQPGKVNINMHIINDSIFTLRVSDTGPGLPEDVSINDADTLGLQLLNVFVGQLNGDMKIIRNGGATYEVVFPIKESANV